MKTLKRLFGKLFSNLSHNTNAHIWGYVMGMK